MGDSGEVKNLAHFWNYSQNELVITHLNINSLRNKFELFTEKAKSNVDLLLVSTTKIDENFPGSQLKIYGFNDPYRVDRNENGGSRIILLFKEDLPVEVLQFLKVMRVCLLK